METAATTAMVITRSVNTVRTMPIMIMKIRIVSSTSMDIDYEKLGTTSICNKDNNIQQL